MRRRLIQILSNLFPEVFARIGFKKLNNPQVRKLRVHEDDVLRIGEVSELKFKGFTIKRYHWPGNGKKVVLVHGWEGQAGNFSDVIQELQSQNYSIFSFDAPSHGYSSSGETNLIDFFDVLEIILREAQPDFLISHSFGSVASTYVLYRNQDISIDKMVLFTTPNKFSERITDLAELVGLSEKAQALLIIKAEELIGFKAETLNVSNWVDAIKVEKALLFHDKNDRLLSIEKSRAVNKAWKNCELIEVEGTGHFRILRSREVIYKTIEFLRD